MACNYKYKGVTYTNREQLKQVVAQDLALGAAASKSSKTRQVFEINDLLGMAAARIDGNEAFTTSEFINFMDVDGKRYMVIDDRLLEEEIGPNKTVYKEDGTAIEIDIEKEFQKFKEGKSMSKLAGVREHVMIKTATELLNSSVTQLKNVNRKTDKQLFDSLKRFADKLGISVVKLDAYLENYEGRYGKPADVKGVADMMNSAIALSNEATVGDFSEEVAHFAIEYYVDQEIVQKMMTGVDQTLIYQEQSEQYRQKYGQTLTGEALEQKVRKEILGKVLASKIVDKFATKGRNITENSIFNNLKGLISDFLGFFRVTDTNRQFFREFGRTLDQMASEVVEGEVTTNFAPYQSQEYYFSLSESEARVVGSLKEFQSNLSARYRRLSKNMTMERSLRREKLDIFAQQISQAKYAEALLGYARMLEIDLKDAETVLSNSEKTVDAIINKERLTNPDYKNPTRSQKIEMQANALGEVDLNNLIVFLYNIDPLFNNIQGNIELMRAEGLLSEDVIDMLERIVGNAKSVYEKVGTKYKNISLSLAAKEIRRMMEAANYNEASIKEYVSSVVSKNFDQDVSYLAAKLYNVGAHGNPISAAVHHLVDIAENKRNLKVLDLVERLRAQSRKLRIGSAQKKLIDEGYMIENIHRRKAENDYYQEKYKIQEKYSTAIKDLSREDANYQQKRIDLENKMDEDIRVLNKKWLESQFTEDFESRVDKNTEKNPLSNTFNRSRAAKSYIRALARERLKVMAPITSSNGKVDYSALDVRTVDRLQSIKSSRARLMSLYNTDGTVKSEDELIIAYDLRNYYNGSFDTEISESAEDLFEIERARAEATMSPEKYALWLQVFAYRSMGEGTMPQGRSLFTVDEEATEQNLSEADIEEILEHVVYIPNATIANVTFQEVYEALVDKRNSLISPYKVANKSGEINGEMAEKDAYLEVALSEVDGYLAKFSVDKNTSEDVQLVKVPNESFKRVYDRMKSNSRGKGEFQRWLSSNVNRRSSKTYQGYPIPSKRYYYKWQLLDKNGVEIEEKLQPTFFWQMKFEGERDINPNYRPEMSGRALQFNRAMMNKYKNRDYFALFGISEANPFSDRATSNQNLWEFRKFFLEEKEGMDKLIGHLSNSYYMLPQVVKYDNEVLLTMTVSAEGGGKRLDAANAWFKNKFLVNDFDADFNAEIIDEKGQVVAVKNQRATIPTHFTRLIENPNLLTDDLAYMLGRYGEMAYNYDEKAKILTKIASLQDVAAGSTFKGQPGQSSNTLKAIEDFISTNVYGNKFSDLGQIGNISVTKSVNALYNYTRNKNLGLNIYVPLTSYLSAMVQRRVMSAENIYLSPESINWATAESRFGAGVILNTDWESISPQLEFKKLLEFTGVSMNNAEMFKQALALTNFERGAANFNALYDTVGYKFLSRLAAVNTMYGVLDNFRLVDGSFVSKRRFREIMFEKNPNASQSEINSEWATYRAKSYYNFLDKSGNVVKFDVEKARKQGYKGDPNETMAVMNANVRKANEMVNMETSDIDRGLAARNPFIKLIGFLHKAYFQRFLESRFKRKTPNYSAGVDEEGSYRTVQRLFTKHVQSEGVVKALSSTLSYMTGMYSYTKGVEESEIGELERTNLRRIRADSAAYLSLLLVYIFMTSVADDDDDNALTDYLAYISARVFRETSSIQGIGGLKEMYNVFDSPSSGLSTVKNVLELPDLIINGGDEITKGSYEGITKAQAFVLRSTPIKNVWAPMYGSIENSRTYFRNNAIGTLPNWVYTKVSGNEIKD